MIFLKNIVRLTANRNVYQRYAKRYGIEFKHGKDSVCKKNVIVTKEQAYAIHKIYFECDDPKYPETRAVIVRVKEWFDLNKN